MRPYLYNLIACVLVASVASGALPTMGPSAGPVVPSRGEVAADVELAAAGVPDTERMPLGVPESRPGDAVAGGSAETASVEPWGGILKTGLALAAVVALIVICAAGFRRVAHGQGGLLGAMGPGGRAPSGVLSVLARYPVGRGQTLVLLKADRRVLLLCQSRTGRGAMGMHTLCEFTDEDEVASLVSKTADDEGESIASRFRGVMAGLELTQPPLPKRGTVHEPVTVDVRTDGLPGARPALSPQDRAEPLGSLRSRLATLRDGGES